MAIERVVVGIDLGTTNSAVAVLEGEKPRVVESAEGEAILPSVVHITSDGAVIVGQDAQSALVAMPERTIAAIKRHMGEDEPVTVAGRHLTPAEVSSLILRALKERLVARFGDQEMEAVITVPAYFNDRQRRATQEAGELAGFIVERIINEPTAAALAYGFHHLSGSQRLVVYDLGGGTFDVSVVELADGVVEVRASTGNSRLGGEDFDWALVDWMAQAIVKAHGIDPRLDLRARARLKEAAETVKIRLSSNTQAEIDLPLLVMHEGQPIGLKTRISRQTFEKLIERWLQETVQQVEAALTAARTAADQVDHVLLVGGSTRIPRVRELLEEFFGQPAHAEVDPDLAVALGAAVQGGLKSGQLAGIGMIATDVAPFSMGIAVAEPDWTGMTWVPGHFKPIITKNTAIPTTRSERFTTTADDQPKIKIEVYQGESEWVSHNLELGTFLLDVPPAPAGREKVNVRFRYNLNGILEVDATVVSTAQTHQVTLMDGLNRTSQVALAQSQARLRDLQLAPVSDAPSLSPTVEDVDEWNETLPVANWPDLVEEAHRLTERLKKVTVFAGAGKETRQSIFKALRDAEKTRSLEKMQDALDRAVDTLLEWEL